MTSDTKNDEASTAELPPSEALLLTLAEHDRLEEIAQLKARAERYRTQLPLTDYRESAFAAEVERCETRRSQLLADITAGVPAWTPAVLHDTAVVVGDVEYGNGLISRVRS